LKLYRVNYDGVGYELASLDAIRYLSIYMFVFCFFSFVYINCIHLFLRFYKIWLTLHFGENRVFRRKSCGPRSPADYKIENDRNIVFRVYCLQQGGWLFETFIVLTGYPLQIIWKRLPTRRKEIWNCVLLVYICYGTIHSI